MTKGNLLIIDDEPLLLKYLRVNLAEIADEVFIASNGIEAISVLERETIHCIVSDVNMPKMNGIELIKQIRSQENNVPFIFYSGHGDVELKSQVSMYGVYDFFNKPNFEGLIDSIKKILT